MIAPQVRLERETGIPFDHILINATHTHHAPTTVTVHGYHREEAFTRQVEDRIVQAGVAAFRRLAPSTFLFRLGEESSVGKNSRLLLGDGTIYWVGPRDDAVRPTGPFDPELPVLAFRRPEGTFEAILFNHSTHTIGTHKPGVRSPSFYGLAAQAFEKEKGGTVIFFEGASGSTHNLDVPAVEATFRIKQAVADGLDKAQSRPIPRIQAARKEISLRVRQFDEAAADQAGGRLLHEADRRSQGRPIGHRHVPGHAQGPCRPTGGDPEDVGPGHRAGRRGDRRGPG